MQRRHALIAFVILLGNVMFAASVPGADTISGKAGAAGMLKTPQLTPLPGLPDKGAKLPGPANPTAGAGAPTSLNFSDKLNPLATPVIGGKEVGGSRAGPATGQAATPTSGNTLVNPLADKQGGTTTSLDQFSNESRLGKITGGSQELVDQAGAKSAPGQQSGDALITGTIPDFAAGRGKGGSKQGQQSDSGDAAPIPYPAAPVETKVDGPAARQLVTTMKSGPGEIKGSSGDDAGKTGGTASSDAGGKSFVFNHVTDVKVEGNAVKSTSTVTRSAAGKSRPAPDGTDASDRPVGGLLEGNSGPSIDETVAAKKRQTGLTVEGKREIQRMKGNERAAADTLAKRRSNAINPGDSPTVSGSPPAGGARPTGNAPEGGPQGAKSGAPHGCPPDSPAC